MELLDVRLPTHEARKSIYDDIATKDKCITVCDYRLLLVITFSKKTRTVLFFHANSKFDNGKHIGEFNTAV